MTIQWLGYTALKIQIKAGLIIVDPFADQGANKMARLKADLVLTTNPTDDCCSNTGRLQGDPFVIDMPGEYEVHDTFVYGYQGGRENHGDNIIYNVKAEGIHIGILGALDHDLSKKQLAGVEGVDILFVPIDKNPMKRLSTIISIVEPRVIIPTMFKSKNTPKLADVVAFRKELGSKDEEVLDKFVIKANQLPQEESVLVILKNGS